MTVAVVTFDLDNTLWDVEPALLRAEAAQRAWLERHRPGALAGLDDHALLERKRALLRREPRLAHHVSDMRRQFLYELQREAGYGEREARSGAEAAFTAFLAERHKVELYEEALAVIEQLARHYRIGALTNGNADIYRTDAGDYFDFAFLAEEVGASKPAPDLFRAAIERAGVEATAIAHVGDSPAHDVAGAREAGLKTVWFNPGAAPWDPAQGAGPDATVKQLTELPAALAAL
ncbi:MAG: HAD family hydrolase [Pseudohaliea sp.]